MLRFSWPSHPPSSFSQHRHRYPRRAILASTPTFLTPTIALNALRDTTVQVEWHLPPPAPKARAIKTQANRLLTPALIVLLGSSAQRLPLLPRLSARTAPMPPAVRRNAQSALLATSVQTDKKRLFVGLDFTARKAVERALPAQPAQNAQAKQQRPL